ncbi:MAG: hypothetical protein WCO35_02780 [Candidatus Nomurabacteria bacterium]
MYTLFSILFVISVIGIFKPKLFINLFKKQKELKKIRVIFICLSVIFLAISGSLMPETVNNTKETTATIQPKTDEEKRMDVVNNLKSHEIEAEVFVQNQVEGLLKAPSTAKFNLSEREEVESATGTAYIIVFGTVDSQNSFGAMLRSSIYAKLDYTNGKGGEIVSLKIDGKEYYKKY